MTISERMTSYAQMMITGVQDKMNIPWKLKSQLFKLIDAVSAHELLYFAQKNITGRSKIKSFEISKDWMRHLEVMEKNLVQGTLFEFGAGKSLAQNLYFSNYIDKQVVVDLNPMLDIELVESSRRWLSQQMALKSNEPILAPEDLKKYGIVYKAPYDARQTEFEAGQVDLCVSTNTLEHIPVDVIESILLELRRVVKESGLVSLIVDYSDHYSHTDRSIAPLNFLKYSDSEWAKYNHDCHFQNRLRHYDYIRLFKASGFDVVEESVFYPSVKPGADLINKYRDEPPTWAATSGHIVLKVRVR